jgi:hypothetical protein
MKKTSKGSRARERVGEMRSEYRLDYRRSRANRFASAFGAGTVTVTLDPDVAVVFDSAESVNNFLRSVIAAMPDRMKSVRPSRRRKRATSK